MTPLIAEDVLLLLLDDESGKLQHATYLDSGIGGASSAHKVIDRERSFRQRGEEACQGHRRW